MEDFDKFFAENGYKDGEQPQAFADWLSGATGTKIVGISEEGAVTSAESVQFVPTIMSFDPKNIDWVVNNYLDADDIRFTGSFAECETYLKENHAVRS